jgi:hypothetical protein
VATLRRLLLVATIVPVLVTAARAGAGAGPAVPGQVASYGIAIQLSDVAPAPGIDPRAAAYITNRMAPGTSLLRRVSVTNTTTAPEQVSLYAAAASIAGGAFQFAPTQTVDELTSWTTVTPTAMTLPAGASASASVVIAVPSSAQPGERYGVVWAQVGSSTAPGIQEISRVGIRMYVSVETGPPPPAAFSIGPLTPAAAGAGGASPALVALVRNTGGLAVDITGELRLAQAGRRLGPFPVAGATIGIGQSAPVTASVGTVPAGTWQAHLALQSGLVRRGSERAVNFPLEAGPGHAGAGSDLLYGLSGVLLAVAAVLLAYNLARRRQTVGLPRPAPPVDTAGSPGGEHAPDDAAEPLGSDSPQTTEEDAE